MPVLPYCVVLASEGPKGDLTGVNGARVERLPVNDLCVFYSRMEEPGLSPEKLQSNALEFYGVVHSIFRSSAVVPFRFPALLADEEHLREHVSGKARQYKNFLEETSGMAQMEVRAPFPVLRARESPKSGTDYLRQQQSRVRETERVASAVQDKVKDVAGEWKHKPEGDHVRLYAKVPRSRIQEFRERLKQDADSMGLKVSGPWPLSEFLPE
ncbi:MAG TPA: GvpL/GvpF family gas vesicle protein [Terriglobales bacterium]